MRRLIVEEPVSRAAVWARRLALFSVAVAAVTVAIARFSPDSAESAAYAFEAGLTLSLAAIALACVAFVEIWRSGRRGLRDALAGLAVALAMLAWPGYLLARATQQPMLNDVSTDLADPPQFSRSSRVLAARGPRVPTPYTPTTRDLQARFYPFLQTIVLDLDADQSWRLVQKAVTARGWRVLEQVSAGGRSGVGHIDATERTLLFGFTDDIAVRVRPAGGKTRVDVRSASRFGSHDFGANARRIQAFAQDLQAEFEAK